jgi:hypothetical protein
MGVPNANDTIGTQNRPRSPRSGQFVPAFGAPLPGLRSIGVAGAAPSPSGSGDLRERLRASAHMHQTAFGGRYVTADDVARCMEAFRPGGSGSAGGGGKASPPASSPSMGAGSIKLPQHFGITDEFILSDCRVAGDSMTCSESMRSRGQGVDSYPGTVTGTLNGSTMSGAATRQMTGRDVAIPSRSRVADFSGPATHIVGPDATVTMREGPSERRKSGCGGASSNAVPASESIGTRSAIG